MRMRRLGRDGPEVSGIGLGCYELTGPFGHIDENDAIGVIHHALDLGITMLDTADVYGPFTNERLVGRAIRDRRDSVFLTTKFGQEFSPDFGGGIGEKFVPTKINGRPEYVRKACDASLERLGVDHIDLYIMHRVDPDVPIEETVGGLRGLIDAGKIRYYGLSEPAPATVRRAHAAHPITVVESEYSLWTRDPEDGMLSTLDELGAGFIAFSPLGRGFLTNNLKSVDDLAPGDLRRNYPRFEKEHFEKNQNLLVALRELAEEVGITVAQLSLAWVLSRGEHIVPIPGTKRKAYVEQNIAAVAVDLPESVLERLDRAMPKGVASGLRYNELDMTRINL
jgi:aryl-alcohol dehydrogenase-like predicted oxidoreductase